MQPIDRSLGPFTAPSGNWEEAKIDMRGKWWLLTTVKQTNAVFSTSQVQRVCWESWLCFIVLLKDTDGLHRKSSCGVTVAAEGCWGWKCQAGGRKEEIYRFCQRRHEIRCETVDEMRQMIGCSDSWRLQKAKKPKLFLRSFIHVCFDTFCDADFLLPLKNTGMFTLKRRIYFTCPYALHTRTM